MNRPARGQHNQGRRATSKPRRLRGAMCALAFAVIAQQPATTAVDHRLIRDSA